MAIALNAMVMSDELCVICVTAKGRRMAYRFRHYGTANQQPSCGMAARAICEL